ncbi:MAG: hypothetical protein HKN76_16645 [Saprospiraceae bacterium]|nr:hypothetical protein [Saprospiraceae bacterium]
MKSSPKRKNRWIYFFLILFLLVDFSYSFYQHYHLPIGGDIAQIVVPSPEKGYYEVLKNPLGFKVLATGERHSNPNRFFSHWAASKYLLFVPLMLQTFVSPITSVYLSIALFKILLQVLLIYLLALSISDRKNPLDFDFLLAACIVAPLFQTLGFNRFMGIIDQSIIYNFFYALPSTLLLVLALPYALLIFHCREIKIKGREVIVWMLVALTLTLSGPLIPGIVLIIFVIIHYVLIRNRLTPGFIRLTSPYRFSSVHYWLLIWISALSMYSLYIGQFNILNQTDVLSLVQRYARMPFGLYELVSTKLGLPILILAIILNLLFIRRHFLGRGGSQILSTAKWIMLFSTIYLMLLPLGGYRVYRPNLIRYDTILPIVICMIFLYGISTYFLVKKRELKFRRSYFAWVMAVTLIFTNADQLNTTQFVCERDALKSLEMSEEKIVRLTNPCPIMEFRLVADPYHSDLKAGLLRRWNIIDRDLLFYQDVE